MHEKYETGFIVKRADSGIIMPVAMFLVLLSTILVASLLALTLSDTGDINYQARDKRALYIADGGIEEGMYTLKANGAFLWEIGSVKYGPTNCDGSSNCWGTNLFGDYFTNSDQSLTTPALTMPASPTNLYMSFRNWFKTETNTDGGFLEASIDGGITWSDISCTATASWYAGQLNASSPYNAHEVANSAFSGNAATANNAIAWSTAACDLTDATYRGQTVMFRFHFWATADTNYPGWYIDNVYVCDAAWGAPYQCGGGTTLLFDNIESGIGAWTNLIVDFPESFGSALVSVIAEESTPEYDTYTLTSSGTLKNPSHVAKAKAKISVHGNSNPYTVKVQSWQRTF